MRISFRRWWLSSRMPCSCLTLRRQGRGFEVLETRCLPASLLIGANVPIHPVEQAEFSGTVARFADERPDPQTNYQAAIFWGDGTSDFGMVIPDPQSGFDVLGKHIYQDAGTYPSMQVVIQDLDGDTLTTKATPVQVADAPLSDSSLPLTLTASEGVPTGPLVVATFTDANPRALPSDFGAFVNWGGKVSGALPPIIKQLSQSYNSSTWLVLAQATYLDEGTFPVSVQVTDVDGASLTSSKLTLQVLDDSLNATAVNLAPAIGQTFSDVPVAQFTDANPLATTGDFKANITWDTTTGESSPGTILAQSSGGTTVFTVLGTHQYDTGGNHTFRVSMTDVGGATATTTGTAAVQIAEPAAYDVQTITAGQTTVTLFAISPDPTVPSATLKFTRPADEESDVTISLTTFKTPVVTVGTSSTLPLPPAGTQAEAYFDIRAIGVTSNDTIVVTVFVPAVGPAPTTNDVYFYSPTNGWQHVQGSKNAADSLKVNGRIVSFVLDGTSLPLITNLTGTIFAINVPVATPSTTTVSVPEVNATSVLRPTTDTGSSLGQAAAFLTTSEITLTLTSSQGSQVNASSANLANGTTTTTVASAGVRESGGSIADDAARLLWENRDNELFWWWLQVDDTTPQPVDTTATIPPARTGRPDLPSAESVPVWDWAYLEQPESKPVVSQSSRSWAFAAALVGLGLPLVPTWEEDELIDKRRRRPK